MLRGSRVYGSPVSGSCTKNVRFSVLCWRNGSTTAVDGSGSSSMSDSWICWKPRIEEPSNMRPSVKTFSPKLLTGRVKCCTVPGRSQNRTSTNSISSAAMKLRTSSALVNINPPCTGQAVGESHVCNRDVSRRQFPGHVCFVSLVLRLRSLAGYRGVVAQQTADAPAKGTTYPGEGLGLPEQGSMSVASMGRRLLALIVDWLICLVIARWLTHSEYWT